MRVSNPLMTYSTALAKQSNRQGLLQAVAYDEASPSGLVWVATGRGRRPGTVAGYSHPDGYYRVKFNGKMYRAHIIVWVLHHGAVPDGYEIDHRDMDKCNNLISNLRLATRAQNGANKVARKDNKSGTKGLSWHKAGNTWMGQIKSNGVKHRVYNQCRATVEAWLIVKRQELHGEFANNG